MAVDCVLWRRALNTVVFSGATTPRNSATAPAIKLVSTPSKSAFNSGKALVGNTFNVAAVTLSPLPDPMHRSRALIQAET